MSIFLSLAATTALIVIIVGMVIPGTAPTPVQVRLSRFAERPKTLEELELEQPFTERVLRPIAARTSQVLQMLLPKRRGKGNSDEPLFGKLQKKLLLAGSPNNLTATDFLGVTGISMFLTGGFVFMLFGLAGSDMVMVGLFSLVGLAVGYLIPNLWLSGKIRGRQKEIQKSMPDALDLLVISVEAGLGFDAALQRLTEKSSHALSREFRRVLAEMRMGRPRREALKEMVARTEVPDLNTFVSAIIQADQLGVSVSRVLAVQAEQMRMLRRQRAEEQAAKAPLKMLFPMILLIFPSMFIVILGPSVITMVGEGGLL